MAVAEHPLPGDVESLELLLVRVDLRLEVLQQQIQVTELDQQKTTTA